MGYFHKVGNKKEVLVMGGIDASYPLPDGVSVSDWVYSGGEPPEGYFLTESLTPKNKSEQLKQAYLLLPVEKRAKYAGIMVQAKAFVEEGDYEAAIYQLNRLVVSDDEQPLKQAFIQIVTGD